MSVMLVICAHVYTLHMHAHTHTYARTHTHTHTHTPFVSILAHIQEVVRLHNEHQMDLYLMEYMKNGGPPKKKGVRGASDKLFDYHSEL